MVTFLLSCAVAVVCSFVCSLLEATLLSLDRVHLETEKRRGRRYAAVWLGMKQRIDRPVAAILILNTVAHTGGATVAGSAFDEIYGDEWIWVFSIIFTMVILLVTEILPKVIGVGHNERLAPVLAPVLSFITRALHPAVVMTEWVARPFKSTAPRRQIDIADLQTMADLAESERAIEVEQEKIIINATRLCSAKVAAVMVPQDKIAYFHTQKSNIENFEVAAVSLHTRYPVSHDGTIDGIVGYVNFKELVASAPSRREIQLAKFIRPLARLSASASLNDALKLLLGRRSHMALVEDGQGHIVGLLTLEDVLEEIVGDLQDEFDTASTELVEVASNRWKIGGGVSLADLEVQLGTKLPDAESCKTLSEWLRQKISAELRSGDVVRESGITFTVIQTRRHQAHRVLVEKAR